MALVERYRRQQAGWNVKSFHAWYQRDGGKRSYTWIKNQLQEAGVVQKAPGRGKHRKRRTRAAGPGMMLHQDASPHEWVPGVKWDLVATMDGHQRALLDVLGRLGKVRPPASWACAT